MSEAAAPNTSRGWVIAAVVGLWVVGLLVFATAPVGPFIYDDRGAIVDNPSIRSLWPLWGPLTPPDETAVAGRPLVNLSLALNYAVGGVEPAGYRAVNVALHLLAGLTLFDLVRRGLRAGMGQRWHEPAQLALAWSVAAWWLVHPLQTESVAYTVQRTELMAGLFWLLTLWASLRRMERGTDSGWQARGWTALAVLACGLGMASKEIVFAAPIGVWLLDRGLFAGGLWPALRARWGLYAGLASTWLVLLGLVLTSPRDASVGFGHGVSPWRYLLTQAGVLAHYLHLSVWPTGLSIAHQDWPMARSLLEVLPQGLLICGLLGITAWLLWRRPALGVVAAIPWLVLGPTSSVLPILTEPAAERRMYLPLASLVLFAMLGLFAWQSQVVQRGRMWAANAAVVAVVAVVAGGLLLLGTLSVQRLEDYRSRITIWAAAVDATPHSAVARLNYGRALAEAGQLEAAATQFRAGRELNPGAADLKYNLGTVLAQTGRLGEAERLLREAAKQRPHHSGTHQNLGLVLKQMGRREQAARHLAHAEALRTARDAARKKNQSVGR